VKNQPIRRKYAAAPQRSGAGARPAKNSAAIGITRKNLLVIDLPFAGENDQRHAHQQRRGQQDRQVAAQQGERRLALHHQRRRRRTSSPRTARN